VVPSTTGYFSQIFSANLISLNVISFRKPSRPHHVLLARDGAAQKFVCRLTPGFWATFVTVKPTFMTLSTAS
jgi:hypothetical protein